MGFEFDMERHLESIAVSETMANIEDYDMWRTLCGGAGYVAKGHIVEAYCPRSDCRAVFANGDFDCGKAEFCPLAAMLAVGGENIRWEAACGWEEADEMLGFTAEGEVDFVE